MINKLLRKYLVEAKESKELKKSIQSEVIKKKIGNYNIIIPLSDKASCVYGQSTKWCISMGGKHWYDYTYKRHKIFIFIDDLTRDHSVIDGVSVDPLHKVALEIGLGHKYTIWDANDKAREDDDIIDELNYPDDIWVYIKWVRENYDDIMSRALELTPYDIGYEPGSRVRRPSGKTNSDVIYKFVNREFPTRDAWGNKNLKIVRGQHDVGWHLVNYRTTIAYISSNDTMYFNANKYSVTTSKIQTYFKRAASNMTYITVTEEEIYKIIDEDIDRVLGIEIEKY